MSPGVSNHRQLECFFNSLFGPRAQRTWKSRITSLLRGESTGDEWLRPQRASNATRVSMPWRLHEIWNIHGIFPDISPCRLTDTCLKINADVNNLKAVLRLKDYRAVCRQDGRHFADDIFKCIFVSEDVWMSIKISRKFVPKGPIDNKSSLVQVIAWPWTGDKPLPEPMMI